MLYEVITDTIAEFKREGALKYVTKDDYFIDTLIDSIEGHFRNNFV